MLCTWVYLVLGMSGNAQDKVQNIAHQQNTVNCSYLVIRPHLSSASEWKYTVKKLTFEEPDKDTHPSFRLFTTKKCLWFQYSEPYRSTLSEKTFLKRAPPLS
jgi:hypothetical protein